MYEISKQRLLQIAKDSPKSKIKIKQWYPDVFDFKKGWYIMLSGESVYQLYLNDSEQSRCYGTMNGGWGSSFGYYSDWIQNRIDDSEVLDLLVKAGVKYGVIESDTNTTLWTYDEENDSIKDGEGKVVYFKGDWHIPVIQANGWEGEGWYKHTWTWILSGSPDTEGYIYLRNQEDNEGYGFYDGQWRPRVYTSRAETFSKCNIDDVRRLMIMEAKRRGYTRDNFVCLDGNEYGYNDIIDHWSFYTDVLYTETMGNGGMIAYKHGRWAEIR